jgi:hypothetical protein
MKKLSILFSIMLFAGMIIYSGCKKDETPVGPPTLSFKAGTGLTSSNTTAKYGDTLWVEVLGKSNGTDNLVKFQVVANESLIIDTTLNIQNFDFTIGIIKNLADKEVWKFSTTDLAGNMASDSIVLTANFGEINTYGPITLGAQNNTTDKGFVSFSNSAVTTYTMAEAFNHQADIDMFLFYENTTSHVNLMTLAAPGSNITGIFSGDFAPDTYTTKNVTYFVKTSLTAEQFDFIANDGIILYSYDPANQFKKAKLLAAGDVYAFKLQSGKYGLLKVLTATGVEDGTLQFSVKIQK